jgi:hypothetical protein
VAGDALDAGVLEGVGGHVQDGGQVVEAVVGHLDVLADSLENAFSNFRAILAVW